MQFGSDGFLSIPLGDGGSGNDPDHRAQNPAELLGKILRIDVAVPDADAEGYDVPPDNPFAGEAGVLPEIWAFGLRNVGIPGLTGVCVNGNWVPSDHPLAGG